jgi:phosphoglucomutase
MHYDVLKRSAPSDKTLPVLNRLKANIVRLQNIRLQKILEDNSNADNPDGEQPTIYHTHPSDKTVSCRADLIFFENEEGQMHMTPSGTEQTLTTFLCKMYNTIEAEDASVKTTM